MSSARREPRPIGDGICEVDLTRGLVALIDEGDAEKVSICNWHANASSPDGYHYAKARMPGGSRALRGRMRMHCYLLCFPLLYVDHKNGNGLDNRRCNLRLCTHLENSRNKRSAFGKVPLKGVYARRGHYCALIRVGERKTYLGSFSTAIEAALAYDAAALRYFGEFAATNASLGLLDFARMKESA